MISFLSGKIIKVGSSEKHSFVDVLTASGVGYRVLVQSNRLYSLDLEVSLYTSFQVREDSQTLYGFSTLEDRDFYELLITVSGVGPKTALAILSMYSVPEVVGIINSKEHKLLSKVSGLGSKGAQKIVVELENRVSDFDGDIVDSKNIEILLELKEALQSLGFSGKALDGYIDKASLKVSEIPTLDELIKFVLSDK